MLLHNNKGSWIPWLSNKCPQAVCQANGVGTSNEYIKDLKSNLIRLTNKLENELKHLS